jgi:hypothetical protein
MIDERVAPASPVAGTAAVAEYEDGVVQYLALADRMRSAADVVLKAGIVLTVLVFIAWALGLLPGAVRLF